MWITGRAFVDETFAVTCAKLGIRITHSPPYRPEGRGKIERFFETVRGQFLVEISPDGKPAPAAGCRTAWMQLNGWFTTWAEHEYHVRVHSSTGATPLARWSAGTPRFISAAAAGCRVLVGGHPDRGRPHRHDQVPGQRL